MGNGTKIMLSIVYDRRFILKTKPKENTFIVESRKKIRDKFCYFKLKT